MVVVDHRGISQQVSLAGAAAHGSEEERRPRRPLITPILGLGRRRGEPAAELLELSQPDPRVLCQGHYGGCNWDWNVREHSRSPPARGTFLLYRRRPKRCNAHAACGMRDSENLEDVGCPMEVRSYVRSRRPSVLGATTTIPSTWRAPVAKAVSRSRVPGVWFIELCFCGVWSLIPGQAPWLAGEAMRVPPHFLVGVAARSALVGGRISTCPTSGVRDP